MRPDIPSTRRATHADLDLLHALIERTYRGDTARLGWTHEADLLDGQRIDRESLAAIIADRAQEMLIFEKHGEIIGCVQIADKGNGKSYLGLLCVDPRRQAGGVGKQLISAAESESAIRFGATHMEMTVIEQRLELISYYERRGYMLTGEMRPFPLDVSHAGRPLSFTVLTKLIKPP